MEFGSFMEFHCREGQGQKEAFDEAFEHVDMAEGLGLHAVWLAESHFSPTRSVLSAPLVLSSAIAARTKRLKIGTAVQVLPLGNPLRIAEEAATVDHIAQGRFEFGVGRSGVPGAYEGYNMDYGQSRERFYEYLEIILKAWTSERFSYQGKYHSYNDVCLVPKPYQKPHPPIRVAANTPQTFPSLGRLGYPIFIGLRQQGISQVAQDVQNYISAYKDAGHAAPIDVSLRVPVYVAESREKALTEPEASFMRQFRRLGNQLASSAARVAASATEERAERGQQLASITWDDAIREKVAVGTPEMVIDRIHEMKERLNLSGVVAEFNAGEMLSREQIASSLKLFCNKVMPAFN